MEERRSWLPAGLESSGLEPDDRASQRGPSGGKRPNQGPTAAGERGPYDQDRPETKRGRWTPDAGEAEEPADTQKQTERKAEKAAPKPAAVKRDAAKRDEPKRDEPKREEAGGDKPKRDEPKAKGEQRPAAQAEGRGEQREQSQVDAMGQDKHREVIGQRYGLSRGRQFLYYGIFVAFVIGAYIGLKAAADSLDKAPAHDPDQAPWSKPGAPQGPLGGFEPSEPGRKDPTDFQ